MANSAGYALAAGGIAAANEVFFAPMAPQGAPFTSFNWRLIPATAILAITLYGLEKISQPLGTGLGVMALMAVLIVPVGNAPTPIENLSRFALGKK
jgi:hypothetical protein